MELTFYQGKKKVKRKGKEIAQYWTLRLDPHFKEIKNSVNNLLKNINEEGLEILGGVVDHEMLTDKHTLDRLMKLRHVSEYRKRYDERLKAQHPMLVIGPHDIMKSQSVEGAPGADDEIDNVSPTYDLFRDQLINDIELDSRFRFLDSNIWHRYVSIYPINSFAERLKDTVAEMIEYHKQGLYKSVVSLEFLEFQCRSLLNSYYIDRQDGHAGDVTPFRFHSESRMKRWIREERFKTTFEGIQWRALLIDDYVNSPLRKSPKENIKKEANGKMLKKEKFTKGALIEKIANMGMDTPNKNKFITIYGPDGKKHKKSHKGLVGGKVLTEAVISICGEEGEEPKMVYDIILLDYFLGKKDGEKHYGPTFLKYILEEEEIPQEVQEEIGSKTLKECADPLGKFWIFPISVFPYAFKSHVTARGDENLTKYWFMSDGENPICCPHLFRLRLYKLLEMQIHATQINLDEIVNALNRLLKDGPKLYKMNAKGEYVYFAELTANHARLDRIKNKSRFARTVQGRKDPKELSILFDHLNTLISLMIELEPEWLKIYIKATSILAILEQYPTFSDVKKSIKKLVKQLETETPKEIQIK